MTNFAAVLLTTWLADAAAVLGATGRRFQKREFPQLASQTPQRGFSQALLEAVALPSAAVAPLASGRARSPLEKQHPTLVEAPTKAEAQHLHSTTGMSAGWIIGGVLVLLVPILLMAGCVSLSNHQMHTTNQMNAPTLVANALAVMFGKVTGRPDRHAAGVPSGAGWRARKPPEQGFQAAPEPEATQYRQWSDPRTRMAASQPQHADHIGKRVQFAPSPSFTTTTSSAKINGAIQGAASAQRYADY